MNKDIDNIDSTDKSVEKALDIMESSSEINVEQLQEMLKDEKPCRLVATSWIAASSYNKKVEWNYPI